MNRSQIEYILTLGQLKNFGKAAEACFVTQSTLSAMVAKFEQQIGMDLFNRKTRPITITPQGEKILNSLKSIHREFQLLDEMVNELRGQEVVKLSIACIPTVAPYLYPLILNKLSQVYPKVNFIIHEFTTDHIVEEITSGNIDIGIVSTPLEKKDLIEYDLYTEDFLLYDCGNTLQNGQYKISDIDLERLWLMEEGHCLRNQVGKICELRQQKKMNGNLTYNCGTIYTLIEMVKMNKGVTLLPRLALTNHYQLEKNCIYQLLEPVPSRKIGLVTHKNYVPGKLIENLSTIIKESIKAYLPDNQKDKNVIHPY